MTYVETVDAENKCLSILAYVCIENNVPSNIFICNAYAISTLSCFCWNAKCKQCLWTNICDFAMHHIKTQRCIPLVCKFCTGFKINPFQRIFIFYGKWD